MTQTNLADAIWEKLKVRVDRRKIELAEPLKRIGRYQVPIELFTDVTVETRVLVVPEGGELPPEEELAAIEEAAAAEKRRGGRDPRGGARSRRGRDRGATRPAPPNRTKSPSQNPTRRRHPRQPSEAEPPGEPRGVTRADLILHSPFKRFVDKFTKNPLSARNLRAVSLFGGPWGRCPTGWGESSERAFPRPAIGRLFRPVTELGAAVVHPLKLALPAATNADVAAIAQSAQTAPVPPQNLDAEESVLGAMMLSPGAIGAVSEILDASDFYRESHAKIYRAALALYARASRSTRSRSSTSSRSASELEGAGGRERIHELAALVPATANAGHYAKIVREMATLRGLIRAGAEVARLGWDRPGDARTSSTRPSRSSSTSRSSGFRPSSATSRRCSRRASSGSRSCTRRARI